MATDRIVTRTCIWHPKDVKPEYRKDGDNRIIRCALMIDGIKNVTYDDVLPDGSLISCGYSWHSKKWIKKHAIPWDHVITDYWAWVTDIIPM
jgi:hypothetical protein